MCSFGFGYLNGRYDIDYSYLGYLIKAELIDGRDLRCIDMPERYWRRIPGCHAPMKLERSGPSNVMSLDEEAV